LRSTQIIADAAYREHRRRAPRARSAPRPRGAHAPIRGAHAPM